MILPIIDDLLAGNHQVIPVVAGGAQGVGSLLKQNVAVERHELAAKVIGADA